MAVIFLSLILLLERSIVWFFSFQICIYAKKNLIDLFFSESRQKYIIIFLFTSLINNIIFKSFIFIII